MSERLDIRLTALYPDFSRSRLQGLIDAGFVKVNGEWKIDSWETGYNYSFPGWLK